MQVGAPRRRRRCRSVLLDAAQGGDGLCERDVHAPTRSMRSLPIALELDRCYLLPPRVFAGGRSVQLRLAPTRNNQRSASQLGRRIRVRGYTGGDRGHSSAGRAPAWHAGGRGFDPRRLHWIGASPAIADGQVRPWPGSHPKDQSSRCPRAGDASQRMGSAARQLREESDGMGLQRGSAPHWTPGGDPGGTNMRARDRQKKFQAAGGLASVTVDNSTNADTSFLRSRRGRPARSSSPQTEIDQSAGAHVALTVAGINGGSTVCDPVLPGVKIHFDSIPSSRSALRHRPREVAAVKPSTRKGPRDEALPEAETAQTRTAAPPDCRLQLLRNAGAGPRTPARPIPRRSSCSGSLRGRMLSACQAPAYSRRKHGSPSRASKGRP